MMFMRNSDNVNEDGKFLSVGRWDLGERRCCSVNNISITEERRKFECFL